jgi:hypothetical protein
MFNESDFLRYMEWVHSDLDLLNQAENFDQFCDLKLAKGEREKLVAFYRKHTDVRSQFPYAKRFPGVPIHTVLAFPAVDKLEDLFTQYCWVERGAKKPPRTFRIGLSSVKSLDAPLNYSLYARQTQMLREHIMGAMVTRNTFHFELSEWSSGNVMLYLQYDQLISSFWIAVLPPESLKSIPLIISNKHDN